MQAPEGGKSLRVLQLAPVSRRLFRCLPSTEDKAQLCLVSPSFASVFPSNVRRLKILHIDLNKPLPLEGMLRHLPSLRLFQLDLGPIRKGLEKHAVALIQSQAASLQRLSVDSFAGRAVELPAEPLAPLPALKCLRLSWWPECGALLALAPATLRSLSVPKAQEFYEIELLFAALRRLTQLRHLKLCANISIYLQALDPRTRARLFRMPRLEIDWYEMHETVPQQAILSEMLCLDRLFIGKRMGRLVDRLGELQPGCRASLRSLALSLCPSKSASTEQEAGEFELPGLSILPSSLPHLRSLRLHLDVDCDEMLNKIFENLNVLANLALETLSLDFKRWLPLKTDPSARPPIRLPPTIQHLHLAHTMYRRMGGSLLDRFLPLEYLLKEPLGSLKPVLVVVPDDLCQLRSVSVMGHGSLVESLLGGGLLFPGLEVLRWGQDLVVSDLGKWHRCRQAGLRRVFTAGRGESGKELLEAFRQSQTDLRQSLQPVLAVSEHDRLHMLTDLGFELSRK